MLLSITLLLTVFAGFVEYNPVSKAGVWNDDRIEGEFWRS